jgi:endonuclease/exonuclease/phosphatase family metal-dependent hydrolase
MMQWRKDACTQSTVHRLFSVLLAVTVLAVAGEARAEEGLPLRVVSFNVWGVPVITPEREERVAEIARRIAELSPDLVACQEVWEDDDAARLAAGLTPAGLTEQRFFGGAKVGGRGSGLWIASRYPIITERFAAFEAGRKAYVHWHLDYLSTKGVAVVEVDTPAGNVAFGTTHLQSHYAFGDYTFIQLDQVLTIERTAALFGGAPLVFTGDINSDPGTLVSGNLIAQLGLAPAADDFGLDVILWRNTAALELSLVEHRRLWEDPVDFPSGRRRTLSDHPAELADYRLRPCNGCRQPPPVDPEIARATARYLDDNRDETGLFIVACRVLCVVFGVGIIVLAGLARRRRPRGVALLFALSLWLWLAVSGGWLGYVGWSFGAYKLGVIDRLRSGLTPGPAPAAPPAAAASPRGP